MTQWYLSYNQKTIGPFDIAEAALRARKDPNGFAWREGFAEWLPISQTAELSGAAPSRGTPPEVGQRSADDIDFKICGAEMQFVEIELDPGESAISEAGAMMFKDPAISMESVFGGSVQPGMSGFVDKLVGAGKRLLTGESMFITVFSNTANRKAKVAFGAPHPGNIIPVTLKNVNGSLICQKDSFLAAAKGVSIGIFFQRNILTGLFGGEGFVMQKLEGDGLVFLHAGGSVIEKQLVAGEELHVDTGCVVGFEPAVGFEVKQIGNVKTMLFGGEGVFLAVLRGPGKVWLQSLPFSRLAGRMLMATRTQREQGSALGGLFQGDP